MIPGSFYLFYSTCEGFNEGFFAFFMRVLFEFLMASFLAFDWELTGFTDIFLLKVNSLSHY